MSTAAEILANAERLIADAEILHHAGRSRSASTLIVVALEQFGAFVEALTKEQYPDALVHMGLFGPNANAHAKRQDALAAHILNYALSDFFNRTMAKRYVAEVPDESQEDFVTWLMRTQPHELTDKEKIEQRSCTQIAAAGLLMHYVRSHTLKDLREYGLYENNNRAFSEKEVAQTINLASRIRAMLEKSWMTPEPLQMAGVNMPEGMTFDLSGKRLT